MIASTHWATGAAWAVASLTLCLVAITGFYAVEARRTRQAQQRQWDREAEERRAMFTRAAAERCLDAIVESELTMTSGERAAGGRLFRRFEREIPFLQSESELWSRVRACAEVARVAGWQDEQLVSEGADTGMALIFLRMIVQRTRWSIEAFLTSTAMPYWADLPEPMSAFAWIIDSARARRNTLAEG